MDNLYEGWDGLPRVGQQLERLLLPLSRNRPGSYRRWDWYADRWAEVVVDPARAPAGARGRRAPAPGRTAALITVLAWVEVPADLRLERGLARDGVHLDEHLRGLVGGRGGALRPGATPGSGPTWSSTAPRARRRHP